MESEISIIIYFIVYCSFLSCLCYNIYKDVKYINKRKRKHNSDIYENI